MIRQSIVIVSRTEGEGHGAEIVLNNLLINYHEKDNLTVITAAKSSVHNTCIANNIEVFPLKFVADSIVPNLLTIEKVLKKLKGKQIVHAWHSKSFEIGWYISVRNNIPLSCTMHDHPCSEYYTKRKLWLLKTIANKSSGVVSVSDALKNECLKNGYKKEITFIHNGLPDVQQNYIRPIKTKLNIGFLGMYSFLKGFNILYDWIIRYNEDNTVHWNLYGDICEENIYFIEQLKGVSNFTLHGHKTSDKIFEKVDIVVNTSTQFDSFPTVLLEAARAGVAAVANTNGGAKEIVSHNVSGFIYDASSPETGFEYLKKLTSDPELLKKFSHNARKHFEDCFKIERMVSSYQSFWERLNFRR
jgi:glycosyltransferase involved in cell wall biosynthesis